MPAWEVMELEGASSGGGATVSPSDTAITLLDGSTLSEFNKAALANPIIRKDAELVKAITNKSFVNGMVTAGKFTKDENDVFRAVA